METNEMTREQLIEQISVLKGQALEFKAARERYKKVESTLRASDKKFRFFFNTAPIGLVISSFQGNIINTNKTIQDLLGYTPEEAKKMNIIDFYVNPGDRQRLLDILHKSNSVSDFETKIKRRDGTFLSVLINSDYIDLDNERVLLTSIHDITQFKQVQHELRESEEGYHLLFSNAPVGITVTDIQGNLIANNQAIQDLLNYNEEEIKIKNVQEFYYDKAERQKLLALTENLGIVRDFETKFKNKDGKAISVLINTDLIDFKDQRQVLLTSIRDITNLKHIEEELTNERDFTNAILDTAASLILVLDKEGLVTRFNLACEKTTGYSFKEIEGQHIWDTLSDNPAITREMFEKLFTGNYPSTHENYWITKNREKRLISWTNTVLLDSVGGIEYIIATGIDITEQRQAETGLKDANQKLVIWVKELEERTKELGQLREMGEQLQNCQNIEEACALSAQYIQNIFSTSHGALYLINSSKDLAEAVEMWGDIVSTDKTFIPIDCWAIRRGQSHIVDASHLGLCCGHISGPCTSQYLCVPMMANGEIMGIIHLNHTTTNQDQQKTKDGLYDEHEVQLAVTVAEHIALALSNLNLRKTLRRQSIQDALTGLFNRRYMEESLERELKRATLDKKAVGIIMFDIDHFKEFNDISGHDGGDAMLRELGVFLNKSTRGGDVVCRYGGEEFVAVLPNATLEETKLRAEELRKGVKRLLIYHLGKPLAKCTISLGVAVFPEHGQTIDELLKNADNALYRAKNEGRDRVVAASVSNSLD
jgi:diguanylate cyclase (GGDEF)-like protein/PAS domain S-box-containing protein